MSGTHTKPWKYLECLTFLKISAIVGTKSVFLTDDVISLSYLYMDVYMFNNSNV